MDDAIKKETASEQREPFMSHLLELRGRLFKSIIVIVVLMSIFGWYYQELYKQLLIFVDHVNEIHKADTLVEDYDGPQFDDLKIRLISGKLSQPFITIIKMVFICAIIAGMPFFLWQLWSFVSPGLTKRERQAAGPILLFSLAFFAGGVTFAYKFVVEFWLLFFSRFNAGLQMVNLIEQSEFIQNMAMILIIFGLVFELPLVMMALGRVGIVSPVMLRKYWRYIILGTFIVGALLTPPDPFTQIMMAGSMIVLYFVSIVLVGISYRQYKVEVDQLMKDD